MLERRIALLEQKRKRILECPTAEEYGAATSRTSEWLRLKLLHFLRRASGETSTGEEDPALDATGQKQAERDSDVIRRWSRYHGGEIVSDGEDHRDELLRRLNRLADAHRSDE